MHSFYLNRRSNCLAYSFLVAVQFSLVSILSQFACADFVSVGAGRYATDLPQNQKGPSDQNNAPALPRVTSNFSKKPNTNSWWSSLIWKFDVSNPWSQGLFPYPLSLQ